MEFHYRNFSIKISESLGALLMKRINLTNHFGSLATTSQDARILLIDLITGIPANIVSQARCVLDA